MTRLLVLGAALGGVLLFLLATASANTTLFARHYPLLLGLNAALAVALGALAAWQLGALWRRVRARVFGSRLTLRLVLLFALMALAPGVLVYTVSVHFLARSIESWFDVKVDAALEGGLALGQSSLDQMLRELQDKARAMALELGARPGAPQVALLERLRGEANVQEAVIVSAGGRVLASASGDLARLVPELPSSQVLSQARAARGYGSVEATAGKPLALRVVVPLAGASLADEPRFLQLRQPVPESLARSAEAVEAAYRDYRQLALARQDLKRIYIVTLTISLAMALLAALSLAALLAARLSGPLAELAEATRAVARGDFSRRMPVTSRDELGVLVESFNAMTRQLEEARRGLEAHRDALETARARLENILANLSAGVLVFDAGLRLTIANHGAQAILGAELGACTGRAPAEWPAALRTFAAAVEERLRAAPERPWQAELELRGSGKTLLLRGAALPRAPEGGHVLVFDDITQLVQAQRANAWAEVARRLAHEIKNPLTPIQLSAERLEMKLAGRLAGADAEVLRRGIGTIVEQVGALKRMVDDFRDYARLPAPAFAALDLNGLVNEVLALYENSPVPVVRALAPDLPPVKADPVQIRQVLHNLLQNAQDALENRKAGKDPPAIEVRTEPAGAGVRLSVSDNGSGFAEEIMMRVFEPYVTTKARGTGLGLAIVKKVVDEHRGEVKVENRPTGGAVVSVWLPAAGTGRQAMAA